MEGVVELARGGARIPGHDEAIRLERPESVDVSRLHSMGLGDDDHEVRRVVALQAVRVIGCEANGEVLVVKVEASGVESLR